METTKGTVGPVSNKDGKYGFKINDDWYNGFGDCPVKRGDEVEVNFEINNNFKNVKSTKAITTSQTSKPKTQDSGVAGMLTSYAKDFAIAVLNNAKDSKPAEEVLAKASLMMAQNYLIIKSIIENGNMPGLQEEEKAD